MTQKAITTAALITAIAAVQNASPGVNVIIDGDSLKFSFDDIAVQTDVIALVQAGSAVMLSSATTPWTRCWTLQAWNTKTGADVSKCNKM